ncbi:MAG: type I-E CRISPR-associated protein Cas6/Cse3/CasE, partial [Chloroflexi bacterium]|nr:type I-E CRISPR-associated protein Cas6/Cse3/CasE [Chloroflexota bacterium]
QSQTEPNWQPLIDKTYLVPPEPFSGFTNPAVKQVDLSLNNGQQLRFRLCANPTIKKVRRNENGERLNSNRVPLVHEPKQIEWLQKQAINNGFHILHTDITQAQKLTSRKKGNGRSITLYTVQFNGRLQITNADTFTQAIQKGIGPAKAFGCGLLSLAPG